MTLPLNIRQKRYSRKHMTSLNEAFEKLRGILPNHHRDVPLSKIEALQLAQTYIKELSARLQNNSSLIEHQQIKQNDYLIYH